MKIPMPCKFGKQGKCNDRQLSFAGVSWFKWSRGMEYTYFFSTNDKWHTVDFYTTFDSKQPFEITIPDNLLTDDFIKYKGFPLKGRGYANGVYYANGKTYIDFILTDRYFAHIKVQCDDEGNYIPNGEILFPTAWDNEEKREKVILKSKKFIQKEPLEITELLPKQMNIFDFLKS